MGGRTVSWGQRGIALWGHRGHGFPIKSGITGEGPSSVSVSVSVLGFGFGSQPWILDLKFQGSSFKSHMSADQGGQYAAGQLVARKRGALALTAQSLGLDGPMTLVGQDAHIGHPPDRQMTD